jgi:dynein assembly factor 3
MCDPATSLLGPHLDVSLLKFQDRDALVEVLQKYRGSVSYDMVKAWDARARKWYGERFDFRRNMVRGRDHA